MHIFCVIMIDLRLSKIIHENFIVEIYCRNLNWNSDLLTRKT